jgi:S1-C subfamily serine protease
VSFAIPINEAKAIIGDWMEKDLQKPMLGITAVAVQKGRTYFYDGNEGVIFGYQKMNNVEYKVNANGSTEVLTKAELEDPNNKIFTAGASGLYVAKITKGLGADGVLQPGDIITKIGNNEIITINDTHKIFDQYKAGDTMDVEIFRNGSAKSVKVLLKTKEDMLKAQNN